MNTHRAEQPKRERYGKKERRVRVHSQDRNVIHREPALGVGMPPGYLAKIIQGMEIVAKKAKEFEAVPKQEMLLQIGSAKRAK